MTMGWTVRPAEKADLEQLVLLFEELHDFHASGKPDIFDRNKNPYDKKYATGLLKSKNNKIILCENKGSVIGFCSARIFDKSYETQVKCMCVDHLFVCRNYRGNGIGTKLFNAMKKIAAENHCKMLDLSVWSFDGSANGFYTKQGMTEQRVYYEMRLPGESDKR